MKYLYVLLSLCLVAVFLFASDTKKMWSVHTPEALPAAIVEAIIDRQGDVSIPQSSAGINETESSNDFDGTSPLAEQVTTVDILSQTERSQEGSRLFVDADTVPAGVFRVTKVIDGDTIEVATEVGVRRVRYIGIDTPETVHPSRPIECFGHEASLKNKALVEGKWVRLERDISDTDRYGRWLRYVYVDDEFVNLSLVAGGYATVLTYPPDVRHNSDFLQAERDARAQNMGLWGNVCEHWNPPPLSVSVPATSQQPPQAQCSIKGNINNQGDRIYHVVGCKSYAQTVITEETGERWFCTEVEAVNAGWRKAGNC